MTSETENSMKSSGTRTKAERQEFSQPSTKAIVCDVNVVFEEGDKEWAEENIISILQKVHDLKVCSKELSYEPGYATELAVKLIKQCNKSLFIIGEKFFGNSSLEHELRIALGEREDNREVVLFVAREDISRYVSGDMRSIIREEKYRVYPSTEDKFAIEKFWEWLIREGKNPSDVKNMTGNRLYTKCCACDCCCDSNNPRSSFPSES